MSRFTGLSWERGEALAVTMADDGALTPRPVAAGCALAWRLGGPRRCIGVFGSRRDGRRTCPADAPVETDSQCPACAWNDPGRLVAKDLVVPPGTFRAYLALFGDDTIKVGLSTRGRDDDRLLEQGAAAHVFVAEGPYPAIRQAEQTVSSGLGFPQHLTWRRKRELWGRPADPDTRAVALVRAAAKARGLLDPASLTILDEPVVDDVVRYGLDPATLPRRLRVISALRADDVLAGTVAGVIGKMLVLDTPFVLDTRAVEGWPIAPAGQAPMHLAAPPTPEHHVQQPALFA